MNKIVKVSEGKIALYSMQDSNVYVDVVFHDETFWMTQKSIAELFEVDVSVASKHIKNIYLEEELNESGTIAKFAIVQIEGNREVARNPDFYCLDVIKAMQIYEQFRVKQDKDYISTFDRDMIEYLKGKDKK